MIRGDVVPRLYAFTGSYGQRVELGVDHYAVTIGDVAVRLPELDQVIARLQELRADRAQWAKAREGGDDGRVPGSLGIEVTDLCDARQVQGDGWLVCTEPLGHDSDGWHYDPIANTTWRVYRTAQRAPGPQDPWKD